MPATRCAAGLNATVPVSLRNAESTIWLDFADPADPVEKIHVPRAAPELAVGDALEPDLLLHAHRLADRSSSIRRSSAAEIRPACRSARARSNSAGRSRLPT